MEKKEYIEQEIIRLTKQWFYYVYGLGAIVLLVIGLLDRYVYPEHFSKFIVYRIITALILLLALYFNRYTNRILHIYIHAILTTISVATMITLMIQATGGHSSWYFVGMLYLTIFALAFFPVLNIKLSLVIGIIITTIYIAPILLFNNITNKNLFAVNTFFLLLVITTEIIFRVFNNKINYQKLQYEYDLLIETQRIESNFKEMIERSTDGVLIRDAKNKIITITNNKLQELLEYSDKEIKEKGYENILNNTEYKELKNNNEMISLSNIVLNKKSKVKLYCNITEYPLEMNNKQYLITFIKDVTKETEAIKLIEEKEEKYRSLFENAIDGIIIHDKYGSIIELNQKFCELHMMTKEELKGLNIRYLESDNNAIEQDEIYKKIFSGETVSYEKNHYRKDGKTITFEVTSNLIKYGKQILIQSFYRDITEKKIIQEHTLIVKKLEDFASISAGLAHNFNNYLLTILGYTENLLKNKNIDNITKEKIKQIESTTKKITEITRKMYELSRYERGVLQYVNLHDILLDTLKMIENIIPQNISIKTDFINDIAKVYIKVDQIEQTIINLIVNAKDAMPNGGNITVKTEIVPFKELPLNQKPHYAYSKVVRVYFKDTGAGIPASKIKNLFKPFFTTKGKGKGLGLGLVMVYKCIEEHKGKIIVESTEGKGTTFIIILPLHEESIKTEISEPINIIEKGILIVDDDVEVLEILEDILRNEGYSLYTETNPLLALEILKKNDKNIQLVITDLLMPYMEGYGFIKNVKSINENKKIIVITGKTINDRVYNDIDIDIIIKKPFQKAELISAVKNLYKDLSIHSLT